MTDGSITEFTGPRRGSPARFYQYGNGGVRVLDAARKVRRLYLFDPSSDTMTERDPLAQEKILRRFVFDNFGMLEETFAFGHRPRTFRFEAGGSRIAVREGGDYGAVGKLFTFEGGGVTETVWGRNGETERVYVFERGDDTITVRKGGWYGDVERTIVFSGIRASLFRDPEAFLQFVVFTEWSESDRNDHIEAEVAKIRAGKPAAGASPYAYTGQRRPAQDKSSGRPQPAAARGPPPQQVTGRPASRGPGDAGIDFIPDADTPRDARGPPARRSSDISFDERRGDDPRRERFSPGRSAEIPVQERFERAREGREPLSRGRSVDIPMEERFGEAREKEQLQRGASVDIPLEERFRGSQEKGQNSRGASVDIPLDERFESSRRERQKLPRGRSADIPYDERRGGGDR